MTERRSFLQFAPLAGAAAVTSMALHPSATSAAAVPSGFSKMVASADAPQSMQDAADYVCNGSNDQNTINAAIAAQGALGGVVALSPGNFNCSGPVKVRSKISLMGSGRASELRATSSWSGGIIQAHNPSTDKISISHLAIDGAGKSVMGIFLNVTSNANFEDWSPDAANYITDVYVHNVGSHGVYITGSRNRAACLTRIRVWNAGKYGFVINSGDGFIHQCESGSSGLDGFRINKANNRFTNCKAWYSDRSGFYIGAVRNEFAACESQDNERHGYHIASGQVSLTSCHADSNSWNSNQPAAGYSGFYIKQYARWVQLIGCQAYDKNEGGRGNWQRWGFLLAGNNSYCQISGAARDNAYGPLYEGNGLTKNSIDVLGE